MNKKLLYFAAILCCMACEKSYEMDYEIRELAVRDSVYMLGAKASECIIPVFASGTVNVELIGGENGWATLETDALQGDCSLLVKAADNTEGVPRMAAVLLTLEGKELRDTVLVKQEGQVQALSCPIYVKDENGSRSNLSQVAIGNESSSLEYLLQYQNIPTDQLKTEVTYFDYKGGWITDCQVTDSLVTVSLSPNDSPVSRRAAVTVYYIDGWKRRIQTQLYIVQSDIDGNIGTDICGMEARLLATEEGFTVNDDYILAGTVISDCSSRNMELNPLVEFNVLDTLASLRTAYVQTEDGMGFKIRFSEVQDNVLEFGTAVKINLYGCTLLKESSPDRYHICGMSGVNLLEVSQGTVEPAVRKISELTADDIYTYVTLTDTEFAFKRGAYLDIAEHNDYKFMDGWASLLIDDEGSSIYAPVNVNCAWRRTGEGLPQGTGNTTGIIVSHEMPRIGDAGQYQIRVLDKSGFAQAQEADDKGWTVHAEWFDSVNEAKSYAKVNSRYAEPAQSQDYKVIVASRDILTSGRQLANGEYVCENHVPRSGGNVYATGVYYVNKDMTNKGNCMLDGKDYNAGVAWLPSNTGWYRWDENGNIVDYNGFVFTFNNLPEAASEYLFTFDFGYGNLNSLDFAHTHPAHWCLEYKDFSSGKWVLVSKDERMFTDPQEKEYVHMRALPWPAKLVSGVYRETAMETGMGFTQHAYLLPAEACRPEEGLQLRLRPYDDRITRLTGDYREDSEDAHATTAADLSGGLRMRFGTIALRYR